MNFPSLAVMGIVIAASGACGTAWAEDAAALFVKNCQACHTIDKAGAARQGPPLWGVIGRRAGTVDGFKYSEGLKSSGIVWTPERLDEWIASPKKLVRDTFMNYRQTDPAIRKTIIDYMVSKKG
jgi:cytochrome c